MYIILIIQTKLICLSSCLYVFVLVSGIFDCLFICLFLIKVCIIIWEHVNLGVNVINWFVDEYSCLHFLSKLFRFSKQFGMWFIFEDFSISIISICHTDLWSLYNVTQIFMKLKKCFIRKVLVTFCSAFHFWRIFCFWDKMWLQISIIFQWKSN